jgi:hypothetical protein
MKTDFVYFKLLSVDKKKRWCGRKNKPEDLKWQAYVAI